MSLCRYTCRSQARKPSNGLAAMRKWSWLGEHHEAIFGCKGCKRRQIALQHAALCGGTMPGVWKPITCSVAPLRTARRQPSTMDAWLSSSEKMAVSALPHSAEMVPRFAAKPVGKSRQASVPAHTR
jgi:hypothetical protein